jgi:tRNA (guanosine-2'-O-)-methyltransferase
VRKFKSEQRLKKIEAAAKARQHSLHLVLENIHDPHNVSAIFRTCDAVGVSKVSLLYTIEKFPKISNTSSSSASKWVGNEKFTDVDSCFKSLRDKGFKIYATYLNQSSVNMYDVDFTEKVALIVGNEHRGVSEEAVKRSDKVIYIPMYGMIQSLNVSVATAVTLYEALRQRREKEMYEQSELTDAELSKLIDEWCAK